MKRESGFQTYRLNTLWLFGGHAVKLGLTLFVAAAVARYLGPSRYGQLNFVLSIILLLQIFGNLGLTGIVKKHLIEKPETREKVLGSAIVLNILSGTLLYLLIALVMRWLQPPTPYPLLFLVIGGLLIADSFRCLETWFNLQSLSKYVVLSTTLAVIIASALKILAILAGEPLAVFAQLFLLENILAAALMLFFYQSKVIDIRNWSFSYATSRDMLTQSWPMIFSGFAVVLYMRIDQIMLHFLSGDAAVGAYAAASRISSICHMIPVLLASALTHAVLKAKQHKLPLYYERLRDFTDLTTLLAYGIILPVSFLSPLIVKLLFGAAFADAAPILLIHIWSCLFVFLGVARNIHIVGFGLFKFSLISSLCGAALNILANALLIPRYGGSGAALATLISQLVANFFLNAFSRDIRPFFYLSLKSLLVPFRFPGLLRKYLQKQE